MSEKPSFFSELKRRNVFRVALTYAVVAWLLIELAAFLLPALDAPGWIITAFVALLALGFAMALFISWAFEATPEGLKRTKDVPPDAVLPTWSRRKFAAFILGVAIIAFALSAYQLLQSKPAATSAQRETTSVPQQATAVAPVDNVSNISPIEQTLRDLDEKWSKAAAAKDLDKTVSFYADDAVVLPPNEPMVTSKNGIRNLWKGLLDSVSDISWKTTRVEMAKSDDMAVLTGAYEMTMKDGTKDQGKYCEVWEKKAGTWNCRTDMFSSNLPAPESSPAPGAAEKK